MGEMEDKLQQLLSSEDGMKRIMSLASALMSGQGAKSPDSSEKEEKKAEGSDGSSAEQSAPDLSKIQETLSKVMGESKKNASEEKLKLLAALKPFLASGRQGSIDRATRMIKTAKVAKTALEEFKGGNKVV